LYVDIVAMTETFLDETVLSSQFCPTQFACYRRDRYRHGGGVLILVKPSIAAVKRKDLELQCEIIQIKLLTSDGPF